MSSSSFGGCTRRRGCLSLAPGGHPRRLAGCSGSFNALGSLAALGSLGSLAALGSSDALAALSSGATGSSSFCSTTSVTSIAIFISQAFLENARQFNRACGNGTIVKGFGDVKGRLPAAHRD